MMLRADASGPEAAWTQVETFDGTVPDPNPFGIVGAGSIATVGVTTAGSAADDMIVANVLLGVATPGIVPLPALPFGAGLTAVSVQNVTGAPIDLTLVPLYLQMAFFRTANLKT